MADAIAPGSPHVRKWLVVFHPTTDHPTVGRLVPGRWKHVSAIGIASPRVFVHVNPGLFRTWVEVIEAPDGLVGMARYDAIVRGCVVVEMPVASTAARAPMVRGWWCVPAVAAMIGLAPGLTATFFPDAFLRTCLASGGRIVEEPNEDRDAGLHANGRGACGASGGSG